VVPLDCTLDAWYVLAVVARKSGFCVVSREPLPHCFGFISFSHGGWAPHPCGGGHTCLGSLANEFAFKFCERYE
jgi:hypothetical protein